MKIEKQYQDDHQVKLIVELDQEKFDALKRRAARKIAERGKIPGFRPGKAPYEIILRTYGESVITDQAVDYLVEEEYSNILKEADVIPGASGTLESMDSLQPPKFTFRVPLAPEVDLGGDFLSIRMPYEWTPPDESEVDAELDDLRQMYATTETVERAAQVGDYILVDVKSEFPELTRTGFATTIREADRDTEWPYPGFARELIGLMAGDGKTLKHKFPKDYDLEALQDKEAEMDVTVKTVRSMTLPELDDEFAKMTGAGETVEALRETIRQDVEARSRADYDDKYFVELIEKIKEGATIKYAPQTLEHEGEHVIDELQQRLAQQGLDLETYYKMRGTDAARFFEEEVKPVAQKRLERSLILDEIVRREKIEVNDDELDVEFNNTLNSLAMQGVNLNRIRGGRREQQRVAESLAFESASRVLTRRALDTLKAIATGEYTPKKEEELKQAAQDDKPDTGEQEQKTE